MRKFHTLYVLLASLLLLGSCKEETPDTPARRVAVIHALGDTGAEGQPFKDYMAAQFKKKGIHAEINHLYLNLVKEPMESNEASHQAGYARKLQEWNPEVILVNQDKALEWVLRAQDTTRTAKTDAELRKLLSTVPTVVAGINLLDAEQIGHYANMTGFEDPLDLAENLKMACEISGGTTVHIELDHNAYDQKLRSVLNRQLKQKDVKATVTFLSAADPETSPLDSLETTPENGGLRANQFLMDCKDPKLPQLQVKYDTYSNTFIKHSEIPQFTAIRTQFGDDSHHLLGGYFSSMETQIDDQVDYAVKILNGVNAKSLALAKHQKQYLMDYRAMQAYKPEALQYGDWSDRYQILNVPFSTKHPVLYKFLLLALGMAVLAGLTLVSYLLYHWNTRKERKALKDVMEEHRQRSESVNASDAYIWYLKEDSIRISSIVMTRYHLEKKLDKHIFQQYVVSDSQSSLDELYNYTEHRGKNKIRLHLSWTGKPEDIHWYELRYVVEKENILQKQIMGVAVRIDDIIETESKLLDIQEHLNEVEQKQNFLNSISHDLRTPLNAVTGFAQLLTSDDMDLSAQETREYCQSILENSDMMKNMINSVMQDNDNYEDPKSYSPLKVSASLFVKQVYQTHQILVPSHLKLRLELPEEDHLLFIDPGKTRLVVNNFVGNAFKFTYTGSITLGWKYLAESQEVMIYCKDTGIGLSAEDQEKVFDRYYKANENAKGTGLGLNISQTIIEKQNGTIGVDSTQGKGSTFWFKFKEYKVEKQ